MSDDLKELLETLNNINEGSSKKPGSVMNEPYGTFRDLEQAQANFKPKKRKGSLLGKSVKKSDDPFRGKLVGSCEESKNLHKSLNDISELLELVNKLAQKNEITDYKTIEAVRQGIKTHFSKPGASIESGTQAVLDIIDRRMRASGNYNELGRFRESLRQAIPFKMKKLSQSTIKESKIKKGSKVSFPEHGIETPGTVIGRKKENSSKKSVVGSGFPKYKINAGHGVKLDVPADMIATINRNPKPKKQYKASKTITLKDSLQAITEAYPKAVAVKAGRKYQILTEAEDMNTEIPPTVIGQGTSIQTAWINAEERINAKIAKYSATIRKIYPMAVARKEGNSFWIKESPSGEAISFSKPTLTEAWKNATDLETKKN